MNEIISVIFHSYLELCSKNLCCIRDLKPSLGETSHNTVQESCGRSRKRPFQGIGPLKMAFLGVDKKFKDPNEHVTAFSEKHVPGK